MVYQIYDYTIWLIVKIASSRSLPRKAGLLLTTMIHKLNIIWHLCLVTNPGKYIYMGIPDNKVEEIPRYRSG